MKLFLAIITMLLIGADTRAQSPADTVTIIRQLQESRKYYFSHPDSSLILSSLAYERASAIEHTRLQIISLNSMGESYRFLGDFGRSLESQYKALDLNKKNKFEHGIAETYTYLGFTLQELTEYRQALNYLLSAIEILHKYNDSILTCLSSINASIAYANLGKPDSAEFYGNAAYKLITENTYPPLRSYAFIQLGILNMQKGDTAKASSFLHTALQITIQKNVPTNTVRAQNYLAGFHLKMGHIDSAKIYATAARANAKATGQKLLMRDASAILETVAERRNQLDSALYFQKVVAALDDEVHGPGQFRALEKINIEQQNKSRALEQEKKDLQNRVIFISLFFIVAIIGAIAFLLYRNNRHKQKTNQLLVDKNRQIEETLEELRNTQTQLIQREKMASLGELTSGIAHEIKNPLNFINNFSDVNSELAEDLLDAVAKNNLEEVKQLADDIRSNQQKIMEHGKRADGIVNSMLQHSRNSTGTKEKIQVKTFMEEYVNLAYHGMRAKDKSFNCSIQMKFDPVLPEIAVVPQDLGRVILNLLNNAFYALNEKARIAGDTYQPTIDISVSNPGKGILIHIRDNGSGIDSKVREKIFQPFFTTKPTGEGTGLGLSLSYDIITKTHGGEMNVETVAGEFTDFAIILPGNE